MFFCKRSHVYIELFSPKGIGFRLNSFPDAYVKSRFLEVFETYAQLPVYQVNLGETHIINTPFHEGHNIGFTFEQRDY